MNAGKPIRSKPMKRYPMPLKMRRYVFILCWLLIAAPGWSSEKAGEYFDRGRQLFESKEYKEAAFYFCYLLTDNPLDQEAKDYLKQILSHTEPGLYKTQLSRFFEMADYVDFLQDRVQELQHKNKGLEKFILENRKEHQKIADLINLSQETLQGMRTREFVSGKISFSASGVNSENLDPLLKALSKKKERLAVELTEARGRYEQLYAIKEMILAQDPALSKKASTLSVGYERLRPTPRDRSAPAKVDRLTHELKAKSLELFEKESSLASQQESFKELEGELLETQQRLSLVQRIIEEKDETIGALEIHLQEIKKDAKAQNQYSKKQLDVLAEKMRFLKGKVEEQRNLGDEKIGNLEKLLAEQEIEFARFNKILAENETNLRKMNNQLLIKSKRVATLKHVLRSKDEKILELDGIVQIYQGKLQPFRRWGMPFNQNYSHWFTVAVQKALECPPQPQS